MSISNYMAFIGDVPNQTTKAIEIQIKVDGKVKYTLNNIAQANMYWACLNIHSGHTASYSENGVVTRRKG